MDQKEVEELAKQFFGNSPLPVHYYDAIREFINVGYRMGFKDAYAMPKTLELPDPFEEVLGG